MFQAEKTQQSACEKFEKISEVAKKGKEWPRRYHNKKTVLIIFAGYIFPYMICGFFIHSQN